MKFLYGRKCSCGRVLRTPWGAERHAGTCTGDLEGFEAVPARDPESE